MNLLFTFLTIFSLFYLPLHGEENFILINGSTNEIIRKFGPNIDERVTSASTFKIILSLIGYDAGILHDEQTPIWNYQKGYDDFMESWEQPHSPKTWMTHSCVWYSKILAFQLGLETIKQYLTLFEYGNQDLSAGMIPPGPINPFWLSSSLKISPKEQVEFIQKLVQGNLLVSGHALQMTKQLLFKEEMSSGWKLFGKTGFGSSLDEQDKKLKVRWFVGWVERDKIFFPFAYLQQEYEIDTSKTAQRVKNLLETSLEMAIDQEVEKNIR